MVQNFVAMADEAQGLMVKMKKCRRWLLHWSSCHLPSSQSSSLFIFIVDIRFICCCRHSFVFYVIFSVVVVRHGLS